MMKYIKNTRKLVNTMAMNNFEFSLPTKVLFGKGQAASLYKEIPADMRVLITYGGGSVMKNGVMEQVRTALKNHTFFEFGGIEPNPGYETLMKAVQVVKEKKIDFLLAVGGGSVLDGTKFIAAAAKYPEGKDPWALVLARGADVEAALPLGCVMTLPATGSEMNNSGVISRYETGDKLSFKNNLVIPRFAVLDPETTFSLPPRQTANGVVDAFVHVSEQYMTFPMDAKIPDRFAEGVYCTLMEDGPKLLENPTDYSARANIMWSCTMGLNEILATGVDEDWVSHAMGHEMTAMYGLDHGRTLAIVLPAVWEYSREDKRGKLLQFAERVLGVTEGSEEERIDLTIAKTREFFTKMGNPTYFNDYDLDPGKIPLMVEKLREHNKINIGERGKICPEDMEKIFRMCVK